MQGSIDEMGELNESMRQDVSDFYSSKNFIVGSEPCLSVGMGAFL